MTMLIFGFRNNAGVMFCPYQQTEDGIEMQFATNYLGSVKGISFFIVLGEILITYF